MLRFIRRRELSAFPKLEHEMFRDRASQFHDRLGWDVCVNSKGEERDSYDLENPLYVVWQGPDGGHGGSLRLLPTTGPTMVNEHFSHVIGGQLIRDNRIWECTRFCLSPHAGAHVASALMLGGGEVMERIGVDAFVGVFDAPMRRIYSRIGSPPKILGTSGRGRTKTSVGLWTFTPQAKARLARTAGVSQALLRLWFDRALGLQLHELKSA